MILNVSYGDGWRFAETQSEIAGLVSEVLATLSPSVHVKGREIRDFGRDAWFSCSDRRHTYLTEMPGNSLRVAINEQTGYGGLMWCVSGEDWDEGGIYDFVWISDNLNPPNFDPQVVADPSLVSFHDPRSTLPISQVRAAIAEFCRVGTGDRPECVDWVAGQLNGQRSDTHYEVESSSGQMDDPWA